MYRQYYPNIQIGSSQRWVFDPAKGRYVWSGAGDIPACFPPEPYPANRPTYDCKDGWIQPPGGATPPSGYGPPSRKRPPPANGGGGGGRSTPGGHIPDVSPPKPCYTPGVGWHDCAIVPPPNLPPPPSGPPIGPPIGPPLPPPDYPPPPGFCPPEIEVCAPDQKRIILSFSATLAIGASATITAAPQTLFRPDQLVIPSTIGTGLDVDDIIVGNRSQLCAAGPTSGVIFSEVSVNTQIRFDTAQPGVDVILQITNTSGEELGFFATMFGPAVQGM